MKISVIFEALTGTFDSDINRSARNAERRSREMQKRFDEMGRAIGASLAVAGGAVALLAKQAINAADEIAKLSQKTGVSTEAISQLQFAASLSGVEDLGTSLAKLNRSIAEAASGTAAQRDAFAALGVSVTDAQGNLRDTEEVLLDLADAFAEVEDGPGKTAVAMDLLGRSGADLIPLLNGGSEGIRELMREADQLGLTISQDTAKAAEQFNDDLSRLSFAAQGAGRALAAELLPGLTAISKAAVESAKDSLALDFALSAVRVTFETVAVLAVEVAYVIEQLFREIGAIGSQLIALSTLDFDLFQFIRQDAIANAEEARAKVDALTASILGLNKAESESDEGPDRPRRQLRIPSGNSGSSAARGATEADRLLELSKALAEEQAARDKATQSIAEHISGLQEELATVGLSREQLEIRSLALQGATDVQLEHARQLLKTLEAREELSLAEEEAAKLYEATRTPLERLNAELERLRELRSTTGEGGQPVLDQETYERGVIAAQDEFDNLSKKGEETGKKLSTFADEAARNMQRAFSDFLFDPFDEGLRGMLRSFAQTLQRMAADEISSIILGSIFPGKGGGGASSGGAAGLFGGLFGAAGSFFSGVPDIGPASNFLVRDAGGYTRAGQPTMIGTGAQPEMFIPQTPGTFTPASEWMQPPTVNLRNINAFDTQVIADFMATPDGERVVLNIAERNSGKFKALVRV